jgi:hypothetical protein
MDIFHSLPEENKLDIFDILNCDIMEDEIDLAVLYTKYPFLSELEDINELVLLARKHLLQKKKEEMKDLLFEEFILKQGDFMDIEIPQRNGTIRRTLYRGPDKEKAIFYLTEEENKELHIKSYPNPNIRNYDIINQSEFEIYTK